jgi:hypothetical protein
VLSAGAIDEGAQQNGSAFRIRIFAAEQRRERIRRDPSLLKLRTFDRHEIREVAIPEAAPAEFGISQRISPISGTDQSIAIHVGSMQHAQRKSARNPRKLPFLSSEG